MLVPLHPTCNGCLVFVMLSVSACLTKNEKTEKIHVTKDLITRTEACIVSLTIGLVELYVWGMVS